MLPSFYDGPCRKRNGWSEAPGFNTHPPDAFRNLFFCRFYREPLISKEVAYNRLRSEGPGLLRQVRPFQGGEIWRRPCEHTRDDWRFCPKAARVYKEGEQEPCERVREESLLRISIYGAYLGQIWSWECWILLAREISHSYRTILNRVKISCSIQYTRCFLVIVITIELFRRNLKISISIQSPSRSLVVRRPRRCREHHVEDRRTLWLRNEF